MLTIQEIALLENQEFFATKIKATEKLKSLFESLREQSKGLIHPEEIYYPKGTDFHNGQIAKGENYEGFPYVLLDFPKFFSQKNIFTFRTMCWFGNSWIFSLIIQGEYLQTAFSRFEINFEALHSLGCAIGREDLWNWKADSEALLGQNEKETILDIVKAQKFLKITKRFPLEIVSSEQRVSNEFKRFYTAVLPILTK